MWLPVQVSTILGETMVKAADRNSRHSYKVGRFVKIANDASKQKTASYQNCLRQQKVLRAILFRIGSVSYVEGPNYDIADSSFWNPKKTRHVKS